MGFPYIDGEIYYSVAFGNIAIYEEKMQVTSATFVLWFQPSCADLSVVQYRWELNLQF